MDPGEFLLQLIKFAFQAGASDMHRQAEDADVLLRLRIDGVLLIWSMRLMFKK